MRMAEAQGAQPAAAPQADPRGFYLSMNAPSLTLEWVIHWDRDAGLSSKSHKKSGR